jgi:hypothetical protein
MARSSAQPVSKRTVAQQPTGRQIRDIARRIRNGENPDVPANLLRRANLYLSHRATYDARRAQVRALANQVRNGKIPRAPADIMAAVSRHLAYRDEYNRERKLARRKNAGRAGGRAP